MELKHTSLTGGGRIAFECVVNGLRLIFARGNENARARLHNAADAHGQRLGGHLGNIFEEAGVILNGLAGKLRYVGIVDKGVAGLVKADVSVGADAKDLNVGAAGAVQLSLITAGFLFGIGSVAAGNVNGFFGQIDMIEKVLSHKAQKALGGSGINGVILIQIVGIHLGKADFTRLIGADQFFIKRNGGGAGGKTQKKFGLFLHFFHHDTGGVAGDLLFIFKNQGRIMLGFKQNLSHRFFFLSFRARVIVPQGGGKVVGVFGKRFAKKLILC